MGFVEKLFVARAAPYSTYNKASRKNEMELTFIKRIAARITRMKCFSDLDTSTYIYTNSCNS